MDLHGLTERLRMFADARDWGQYHNPKNLIMALSGEVGELSAVFQWLTPEQARAWDADPEVAVGTRDEIADVMVYLVRLADVLGIDLIDAAHAKIDHNEDRFPADTTPPVY